MPRRKTLDLVVRISCPTWLTAAQARREVRTLINEQTHFGHIEPDNPNGLLAEIIGPENFRAKSVSPLPKNTKG
jgi:hypothetical protein